MDSRIDRIRKDIVVEPVKSTSGPQELNAMRISYLAPTPAIAQLVVNQLAALFIDGNVRARDQQSVSTTNFLAAQLDEARQDLAKTEQSMRDYKLRYLGELPEQEQSNLQILSSLQAQLTSSSTEFDRREQEKTYLGSMRSEYKSLDRTGNSPTPNANAETLPELQAKLADLQSRYTDRYPDIIQVKAEIARMESLQRRQESSQQAASLTEVGDAIPVEDGDQPNLVAIDGRLKAVSLDLESRKREMQVLRQRIQVVQAHLNVTPVREEQLAEVTRDYQNAEERYESLLQKESQSELATNLEKHQQGEQFRIIDPPSLPVKPVQPNRVQIVLGGWAIGLGVGLGLTWLREDLNTTLQRAVGLEEVTSVPLLVSIPLWVLPGEQKKAKQRQLIEALVAGLLVVASLGLGAFSYWVN